LSLLEKKRFGNWTNRQILGMGILVFVFAMMFVPPDLQVNPYYSSAYEGAKAYYHGAWYQDKIYTSTQTHTASICRFDATDFVWDVDMITYAHCNLEGDMTTVFIPSQETMNLPSWIPQSWYSSFPYYQAKIREWDWDIKVGDYWYSYSMEEWHTKWYMNIEAKADSEYEWQRYINAEIWVRLDTQPIWYFEGQEQAFFGIAKIQLTNLIKTGKYPEVIDVTPEGLYTSLPIYLSPFGIEDDVDKTAEYISYKDTKLNPQFFRDEVYTRIRLNDFGIQEWWDFIYKKRQGDTVTFEFTVVQFVIGEWKSQDIQDIPPPNGGRDPVITPPTWWDNLWFTLAGMWTNVENFVVSPIGIPVMMLFTVLILATLLFWFKGLPKGVTQKRGNGG
jgi:hypothetical protein